jgi:NADH:ubiquinone oxidoreductase subunit 6 (subunit J)
MTGRAVTIGYALLALVGPMIWASHFFAVYLAEAVLCSPAVAADGAVYLAGVVLTIAAVIGLLWVRRSSARGKWSSFVRPLIDLSIVAVVLTAIPLVIIDACRSSGA